jgi:hypothetical protein
MADDSGAEARQAAVLEVIRRSAELRALSAELVEVSRELRARVAEVKRRVPPPSVTGEPPLGDTPPARGD